MVTLSVVTSTPLLLPSPSSSSSSSSSSKYDVVVVPAARTVGLTVAMGNFGARLLVTDLVDGVVGDTDDDVDSGEVGDEVGHVDCVHVGDAVGDVVGDAVLVVVEFASGSLLSSTDLAT